MWNNDRKKMENVEKTEGPKTMLETIAGKFWAFWVPDDIESAKFWKIRFVGQIWSKFQVLGTKYLVRSTWYQVLGTKYLVPSTRHQVPGTKYLVPSTWYQVPGTKYLVPSTWYQVLGTKYLVPSTWYQVLWNLCCWVGWTLPPLAYCEAAAEGG